MSTIHGLLVPNNYKIYCGSIESTISSSKMNVDISAFELSKHLQTDPDSEVYPMFGSGNGSLYAHTITMANSVGLSFRLPDNYDSSSNLVVDIYSHNLVGTVPDPDEYIKYEIETLCVQPNAGVNFDESDTISDSSDNVLASWSVVKTGYLFKNTVSVPLERPAEGIPVAGDLVYMKIIRPGEAPVSLYIEDMAISSINIRQV